MSLSKKPAADRAARAIRIHLDDDNVPVICPTCQAIFCFSDVRSAAHERSAKLKKPAASAFATGPHRFRDNANLHLICPTCQTLMKMQQNQLSRLKPILQKLLQKKQNPLPLLTARAV